jgi:hypothetical protein
MGTGTLEGENGSRRSAIESNGERTREEEQDGGGRRTYCFGLKRLDSLDMSADVVRDRFKFA